MIHKFITHIFFATVITIPITLFPATSSSTRSSISEIATSASSSSSSSSSSIKSGLPLPQEKYFQWQPIQFFNKDSTAKDNINIPPKCHSHSSSSSSISSNLSSSVPLKSLSLVIPTNQTPGDIIEKDEDKYADMEQEIKKNLSHFLINKHNKIDPMEFLKGTTIYIMHQSSLLQYMGTQQCPCIYFEKPPSKMLEFMLNAIKQIPQLKRPLYSDSNRSRAYLMYMIATKLQNTTFAAYLYSLCQEQSTTGATENDTEQGYLTYYDLCFQTQCTAKRCGQLWTSHINIIMILSTLFNNNKYHGRPFPANDVHPKVVGWEAAHSTITEIHLWHCLEPKCDPGFWPSRKICNKRILITPKINQQLLNLTAAFTEDMLDRYYAYKYKQAFPKCSSYYLSSSSSSSSCSSGSSSSSSSERHLLTSLADKEHKHST